MLAYLLDRLTAWIDDAPALALAFLAWWHGRNSGTDDHAQTMQ